MRTPETDLTPKEIEIMAFLKNEIMNRGFAPSVREIGKAVGLNSTSSVHSHLKAMERKGFITRFSDKSRSIVINDDQFNMGQREIVSIPIVGNVAAGQPIFASQNIEGYFPMLAEDMPSGELFMLRVKGESMINVGIFNGDLIAVKKQESARNGDIVVALIDDSATVKTFYKEEGHIRLQPENDTMDPIIVSDCTILGKLAGLYRSYR
jgi:repressor LexA